MSQPSADRDRGPLRRGMQCASGRTGTTRAVAACVAAPQVEVATREDFFAGRCDRLGGDLVLDLTPEAAAVSSLPGAVPAPAYQGVGPVLELLRARRPDLVWLDGVTSPITAGWVVDRHHLHVLAIARAAWRGRAPALVLVDDVRDAVTDAASGPAEGLVRPRYVGTNRPWVACRLGPRRVIVNEVREETVDELAAATWGPGELIDVRSADEFASGHVPGAVNVPLDDVVAAPTQFGQGPLHVVCQSGRRSLLAVEAMASAGVDAVSVAGGTNAWRDSGRPVEQ